MSNILYLLPTNRDWKTQGQQVADNVLSLPSKHYQCVAVFSETCPPMRWGHNVTWMEEKGKQGPINGFNLLTKAYCDSFDYFVCVTDDIRLINTIDHTIEFLTGPFFKDRKYKITSLNPGNVCNNPTKGQILGDKPVEQDIAAFPLCRFPVLSRECFKLLGAVIFNEEHFYHSADIWLGYWLGLQGEPVSQSGTFIEPMNPQKDPTFEVADCNKTRLLIEKSLREPNITYNVRL